VISPNAIPDWPLVAKQTFAANLTSAKRPRPRQSRFSFDHFGNVTTQQPLQGNCAGRGLRMPFERPSSKASSDAIPKLNWRNKMKRLGIEARGRHAQSIAPFQHPT
jgi:hypothetical protein